MDQETKQKSLDNLTRAETVLVTVAKTAGFDALASGLALYLSCIKLGKNTSIQAKPPSVGDAQNLYGVDKIGQIGGSKNLVVVINNAVDNVDKVTYSLEETQLRIVIHPFPGAKNVTQEQVSFEEAPTKPNLIFAIGYESAEQLKQEITHEQIVDSNCWIINISKKDMGQIFAQVNIFNDQASSISEVSAQLFQQLALPLDEDIAYNLYAGLLSATNNFSPALTTPFSLDIASWLIKFGAGRASFAQEQSRQASFTVQDQIDKLVSGQQIEDKNTYSPSPLNQTPIENVERKSSGQETWLKPPKIYKGSKSFDREN